MRSFRSYIKQAVFPRALNEDIARQEFILNILLASIISLLVIALFIHVSVTIFSPHDLKTYQNNTLPLAIPASLLAFFVLLYFLSRKGFVRTASYLFLAPLFLLAAYMGYKWGVDLPAEILFYAVLIIMSGVLISTRFAFLCTLFICTTIVGIGYLHNAHIVIANRYWSNQPWIGTDMAVASILFLIIATVSWLSNREIEKSLLRARKSEAELKAERDLLEVKVEERTRELKGVQATQVAQLYRFAEFGKLSAGLFHDLMSPLSAMSLNIQQLRGKEGTIGSQLKKIERETDVDSLLRGEKLVEQAARSAKKLEALVSSVKKQLSREHLRVSFVPCDEVCDVIAMLAHRAREAQVSIETSLPGGMILVGDPAKFHQVVLNLTANAIDAYREVGGEVAHVVQVSVKQSTDGVLLQVSDSGEGIAADVQANIFEPFFTTKKHEEGTGLGLSITKRIVEEHFGGTLTFKSEVDKGSVFTATFPSARGTLEA